MAIRFFDMFAGIGGFRSGLEAVGGFECIGHCEIDKKANTAYCAIDLNSDPKITDAARCVTARQDSGVSKHRGEHSGVLVEEGPRAILRPDREKTRQNGRRMKEPEEPMFTLTAQDRHGVYHRGRIRKLTPRECWRLQGFTDEQFNKAAACIHADGHLYKMAGNSVSVPVISAIGRKIRYVNEKYHITEEMHERDDQGSEDSSLQ